MPWRDPGDGTFPTLAWEVAAWIESYCVIPDREDRGLPLHLTDEQLRFLAHYYRIDPATGAFHHRRGGQLIRPQKWGKGPFAAAVTCAEAGGPVRFDGWDADGLPVGRQWATPHIQITACSEDQTDNTWRALQPMIELSDELARLMPDTGLTRINLDGGGIIEPVTASARSRLGARISFAVQDETHAWTRTNHGIWLADTQRRNLAGVGGRFLETSNAYAPEEESVAQLTQTQPGVYIDDVEPGAGSIRNKAERRRIMNRVYGDSLESKGGWVNLDRIDVEVEALVKHDPAQAERFFLNRKTSTEGSAFDRERWDRLTLERRISISTNEVVCIGVDGALHDDALAVVACHVRTGYMWPLCILERPDNAPEDYEHDQRQADGAVRECFERYVVWRLYGDDQYIHGLMEGWANRYGQTRVVTWHTNRPRQIAWAVRHFSQAINDSEIHHDGNETMSRHIGNARKRALTVLDDDERPMHSICKDAIRSPRKIDAAMAAILAWEARGDCVAMGAVELDPIPRRGQDPRQKQAYEPDFAPPASALAGGPGDAGPMSI
jgi:hypothetical protein